MYTWKANRHGEVVRTKARLVSRGLKQREGIDLLETFAPTPPASCFDLLGAVACELGLDLCRFDAEQAFPQSSLDEDFFMRMLQRRGYMPGKVVHLNRRLYHLNEASADIVAQPRDDPHEESCI